MFSNNKRPLPVYRIMSYRSNANIQLIYDAKCNLFFTNSLTTVHKVILTIYGFIFKYQLNFSCIYKVFNIVKLFNRYPVIVQ